MDRCKHRGKPAEPFAAQGMYGVVSRIAPAGRGTPAMVHCLWGEDGEQFATWERLSDVSIIKERKPR